MRQSIHRFGLLTCMAVLSMGAMAHGQLMWTNGPAMPTPLTLHTATVLQDGRILFAGGSTARDVWTSSCEIYDPASDTYQPTGSLHVRRHGHSATLLPDGRVLVIGGFGDYDWLNSAEIYDPTSGTWSRTQPLYSHGVCHAAILLPDGRVLVVGGAYRSGDPGLDDRVEFFDPARNVWSAAAPHQGIGTPRDSVLLNDGRVLFTSGRTTETYLYDPVSDAWQSGGAISIRRDLAVTVLLPDGRVMVIGGVVSGNISSYVDIYDPAANAWSQAEPLHEGRVAHTATVLPDGRVVVVGGRKGYYGDWQTPDNYLNRVEIYNPCTGQWDEGPALTSQRADHTSTLLRDGRLFVAGGQNPAYLDSVEALMNTSQFTWTNGPAMPTPLTLHTATVLQDGRILFAGGSTARDVWTSSCEIYDPASDTYQPTGSLHVRRHGHSATLLPDGRVLVIGGFGDYDWLNSAEIYDPTSGAWSRTQPLYSHGVCHAAILLQDGRVLVVGGYFRSGDSGMDDRVEIFDPASNTWSEAAYHEGIESHRDSILLNDGRVLFTSGRTTETYLYDPVSNAWQSAGAVSVRRYLATPVLLPDGRVMVIGGVLGENIVSNVDIYDPVANTWSQVAPLRQGRVDHTATVLPDGRVVVVGGCTGYYGDWYNPDNYLNRVEIYNPCTGQWDEGPALTSQRADHTSTLLRDGRLFVAGGQNPAYLDSVEALMYTSQMPCVEDISVSLEEDNIIEISLAGSDPESEDWMYSMVTPPAHGVALVAGSVAVYLPDANYYGSDAFTYQIDDGTQDSCVGTVSIQIANVNDEPMLMPIEDQVVEEGQLLEFSVSGFDPDPDDDPLSYSAEGLPEGATFDSATRTFRWTPTYEQAGEYSVTFRVADGNGGEDEGTIQIEVQNANEPPVACFSITSTNGHKVWFSAACSYDLDAQPDDSLQYAWNFGDGGISLGTATQAVHTYKTAGTYTVTLTVTDEDGASSSTTQTVFVNNKPLLSAPYVLRVLQSWHVFCAAAYDTDGSIVEYDWTSSRDGSLSKAPFFIRRLSKGCHTITVKAKDNLGVWSPVRSIVVYVN